MFVCCANNEIKLSNRSRSIGQHSGDFASDKVLVINICLVCPQLWHRPAVPHDKDPHRMYKVAVKASYECTRRLIRATGGGKGHI